MAKGEPTRGATGRKGQKKGAEDAIQQFNAFGSVALAGCHWGRARKRAEGYASGMTGAESVGFEASSCFLFAALV